MYSRQDILKAIKKKEIKISPFDEKNLQPNTYHLHLDGKIALPQAAPVDPTVPRDFSQLYIEGMIGNGGYVLKPGKFILARTAEDIAIPKSLAGFITTRSTLARMGISVVQSAPILQAGHGVPKPRKVVIELFNAGPFSIVLKKGMSIANISFFELKTPSDIAYDAKGPYGNPKKWNELLPIV